MTAKTTYRISFYPHPDTDPRNLARIARQEFDTQAEAVRVAADACAVAGRGCWATVRDNTGLALGDVSNGCYLPHTSSFGMVPR